MKRLFSCLTLFISLMILSCSNDDDPAPAPSNKVVFELDVPENLFIGDHEIYILATAPDGSFLGLEKIYGGQRLVIDTAIETLPEKVNITRLDYSPPNPERGIDGFYFYTDVDVPTGSKWRYDSGGEGFSGVGAATVNLSNYPAGSFCSISNIDGYAGFGTMVDTQTATLAANLSRNPGDLFLSTVGTSDDPRYYHKSDVSIGSTMNLDYATDFLPFDHSIRLASDGLTWFIIARGYNTSVSQIADKERNGHEFGFFYGTNDNGLRLGVNDGYVSYWTSWFAQSEQRLISYEKWGEPPVQSDFELFEGDFEITNDEFNNFTFTTTGTFHYLNADYYSFSSDRYVMWSIRRSTGSSHAVINQLPARLLKRFPKLSDIPGILNYSGSTFFRTTTAKATDLYIDRRESGTTILEGETWIIRKYQ